LILEALEVIVAVLEGLGVVIEVDWDLVRELRQAGHWDLIEVLVQEYRARLSRGC
jgi:hypothetical protein